MPHCPRCEKRFTTDQKVIRHLNQPRSSCANLIDDLITLSRPLQPTSHHNVGPQELENFNVNFPDNGSFDMLQSYGDIEMATPQDTPSNFDTFEYREEFIGASQTFGLGTTFMGNFDLDKYSGLRQENLYYPFASRDDWEMAAFLLRSGLSMAKIDDFLKLQVVSVRACK
jgi:hypothetical protein